ncbi:hypothetical protein ES288_A04G163800v1 [Gossypium darwinii]|uniref:Reverse transcriptase zinc-binding domain-containing protein n=1 Tax=Gossypium darwinii TaxID=34276 RepID=A0A5D2GZX2_GOSDA|nr:hypothetical protein ES288_A04G163800v1 [Gossypium darwinii]
MISIDRLPTKVFLIRRDMKLDSLGDCCPWCYRDQETAGHLFFHCNFIASFWRKIMDWWEVKWRQFEGFSNFFVFCKNVSFTGVIKILWMISVSAACWSVWLARNELVFNKKWPKMSNLVFLSKTPALIGVKFNVCGVMVEDEARCKGVLRNSDGEARALFFGQISAKDSLAAQVGAVCIALDIYEVDSRLSLIGFVSFLKADKNGNKMAEALAGAGLKRQGMFKSWW